MNRRRFLASGLAMVGAHLALHRPTRLFAQETAPPAPAPASGPAIAPASAPDSSASPPGTAFPDLAVARGEAQGALASALDALGGIGRFVRSGQVVVIKPNASFDAPPAWGATTDPRLLAAVIDACLTAGARRVIVADHTMGVADKCFARTGILEAVAAFPKAKLVSLDDETAYVPLDIPTGRALRTVKIPALLQKADVLINLPKAKSHAATGVSLGMKNLMGLVWDRHVFHDAMDIHQGIADLATAVRPHLTILDALVVLKTGGPNGPGETESPGLVVVGADPVAVDAYGVGICAWNQRMLRPEQVDFVRRAAESGVGSLRLDALRIARAG